ncbi:MAG: hypothetical protein IPM46_02400 [Flavobacteriales bacterium]|nr:hypothetical protein [Flavobacteriales bacterium]
MHAFLRHTRHLIGLMLMSAFLLVGCSKDEVIAPGPDSVGTIKRQNVIMPMNESEEDSAKPNSTSDDSSISDDGDDVGDGERNRKKKPNN